MKKTFSALLLACSLLFSQHDAQAGSAGSNEQVTFVVHCYDVGAQALENRPGVISVKRGWLGFREVDRVRYDPRQVSREQLENWLRQDDTYVETVREPGRE
jgi:hypothetical protein